MRSPSHIRTEKSASVSRRDFDPNFYMAAGRCAYRARLGQGDPKLVVQVGVLAMYNEGVDRFVLRRVTDEMDEGKTNTPIPPARVAWQRTARRLRVPLGFCFAALFLVLARPSGFSLGASLLLTAPGLLLRAVSSGYVKKNEELARTGPYAWTRNPLYLGSMLIAFGFALASRSLVLTVVLLALFLAIYWPVISSEERFLRGRFADFAAYAAEVPRLLPRLTPASFGRTGKEGGGFSRALYLQHREYNSLLGAAAIYAALLGKMLYFGRS